MNDPTEDLRGYSKADVTATYARGYTDGYNAYEEEVRDGEDT